MHCFELPQILGSLDLDSLLAALTQIFECGCGGLALNKVLHALALIISESLRNGRDSGSGLREQMCSMACSAGGPGESDWRDYLFKDARLTVCQTPHPYSKFQVVDYFRPAR
jgi:hypothetical protein